MKNTSGVGNENSAYFPIASSPQNETKMEKNIENQAEYGHIMVVEDEISLSKCYEIALKKMGYKVTTFNNPLESVKAFKNAPDDFGLVCTDIVMPKMNGLELSRQILAIKPSIPIVMVTGNGTPEQKEEARQIGVKHFLYKPVNFVDLSKLLKSTINPPRSPAEQHQKDAAPETSEDRQNQTSTHSDFKGIFDEEFLAIILPQFYKDRGKDAEQLTKALKEKDYQQIYDIGHKIKGSAQTLEYNKYISIGNALQMSAKGQDSKSTQSNIDHLLSSLIEDQAKLN